MIFQGFSNVCVRILRFRFSEFHRKSSFTQQIFEIFILKIKKIDRFCTRRSRKASEILQIFGLWGQGSDFSRFRFHLLPTAGVHLGWCALPRHSRLFPGDVVESPSGKAGLKEEQTCEFVPAVVMFSRRAGKGVCSCIGDAMCSEYRSQRDTSQPRKYWYRKPHHTKIASRNILDIFGYVRLNLTENSLRGQQKLSAVKSTLLIVHY